MHMPPQQPSIRRVCRIRQHLLQPNETFSAEKVAAGIALAGAGLAKLAEYVSASNAGPKDLHEMIEKAPKTGARIAVIGMAISGIQAMKTCLAEGVEPVGFEADADIGGFWRYKEDTEHPSVYRSTHIDTDRDMVSHSESSCILPLMSTHQYCSGR